MPLSVCPNCETPMTEVQRRGVFVDVCPSCRGVWLDGGELEVMLAAGERPPAAPVAAEAPPRRERYVRRDDYRRDHPRDWDDDDDDRDRRRGGRRREGGLMDLLGDIFD